MIEYILFIVAGLIIFLFLLLLAIVVTVRLHGETNDMVDDLQPCQCKDVNKCTTWCIAKQRFYDNPPD